MTRLHLASPAANPEATSGRPRDLETVQAFGDALGRRAAAYAVDPLLSNAVRHEGSTVKVERSSDHGNARLAVTDDGPGIPPTDRERVFQRFVRLDPDRAWSTGGTGLGLAIVYDAVLSHEGRIVIDDPNPGASFTVQLPCGRAVD